MADLEPVIHQWIEAFNQHNLDKLLALYADNARHYSPKFEEQHPETKGWMQGKDQLRLWWQSSFEAYPNLQYLCESVAVKEPEVFLRYRRKADAEPDRDVFEYFRIEDELIVESRVLRSFQNEHV